MGDPKLKPVDDGQRLLMRDHAPCIEDALSLTLRMLSQCPEHHHAWRIEIQKSPKGRRAYVTVTFQRNYNAPPLNTSHKPRSRGLPIDP